MSLIKKLYIVLVVVLTGITIHSCANKAQGPTGGAKDETPPKVIKSTPLNASLNFRKKVIEIVFDENVSIEKASDNILISPPQLKQPDVKANAHIVRVSFEDDLMDSTTYTINFGNGIVDLNEKNPLKDYRFSFSTGNEIDTMKVSGQVLNAQDLNPISGIYVGIYKENEDSAFFTKPFLRIGRTNEFGQFVIDNMKAGSYKVFALGDVNKDFFYQPGEGLAFHDSIVTPTVRMEEMRDTVWLDSITIDSIRPYPGLRYLPDDLVLHYFKENKKRQYLIKSERKQAEVFQLFFGTTLAELPTITPLNFDWDNKFAFQTNLSMDTLSYWLTDSTIYKLDTLEMSVSYLKTDSLYNLVPQVDTISVFERKAKINLKAKKGNDEPKTIFYNFTTNIASAFEVYNPVMLKFNAPLAELDLSKIELREIIDTTYKVLKTNWIKFDSIGLVYAISNVWVPEKSYELVIDSAAFQSIYQHHSDKFKSKFKIKSLDEYSTLKLSLASFDSLVVFQLLNTRDEVLKTLPTSKSPSVFEYLKPGDYYIRGFIDSNRNGKWDTGDISKNIQPEKVYYNPKKLSLRANWEFEEVWDINSTPLLQQKAVELRKDAAKSAKK